MRSVVIRLKRIGCYKYPVFEIVVILKKNRLSGKFIEKLGYLNPNKSENFFFLNSLRLGF
jgi:ribosomal protein S16